MRWTLMLMVGCLMAQDIEVKPLSSDETQMLIRLTAEAKAAQDKLDAYRTQVRKKYGASNDKQTCTNTACGQWDFTKDYKFLVERPVEYTPKGWFGGGTPVPLTMGGW